MREPTPEEVRQDLYVACRIMDGKGLTEGFGHISYRFPGTDRVMMPPRRGPGIVRPEEMLVLDLEGNVVEGEGTPALEYYMHARIYRRRPDVRSVCRTHSPMVQALGLLGQPIRPVHGFGTFLGTVPVFPIPYLITTPELGDQLAEALGQGEAVVMRGNGAITVGRTVQEALVKAVWLEEDAFIQVHARAMGEPIYFTEEEAQRRAAVPYNVWARAWEYWKERSAGG